MKKWKRTDSALIESIFHPSDFTDDSKNAFAHALAIALIGRTTLDMLHVGAGREADVQWDRFPSVRDTLESWGLLEKDSPRSAIFEKFLVRVKKATVKGRNATSAIMEYLEENPMDLIVLATQGRKGLPHWVQPSVAEAVARLSETMTLFIPHKSKGFVSLEDGTIDLGSILVPIDHEPSPIGGIHFAIRASEITDSDAVDINLLHIGGSPDLLEIDLPKGSLWNWKKTHLTGNVVDGIVSTADAISADLIVMATEGRNGILDALRGSITEQVLREASCPVLAVPVEWSPGNLDPSNYVDEKVGVYKYQK